MPPGNTARGVKRGEMMMFSKHFRINILQQMRMIYLHIFEETQIENVSSMLDDFHFELSKMSGSFESQNLTTAGDEPGF